MAARDWRHALLCVGPTPSLLNCNIYRIFLLTKTAFIRRASHSFKWSLISLPCHHAKIPCWRRFFGPSLYGSSSPEDLGGNMLMNKTAGEDSFGGSGGTSEPFHRCVADDRVVRSTCQKPWINAKSLPFPARVMLLQSRCWIYMAKGSRL